MNNTAVNLVAKRGNRCSATILTFLEDQAKPRLDPGEWERMRQVILDNVNDFKDLAIDIVRSETDIINDRWLEQITAIHDELRKLRRAS